MNVRLLGWVAFWSGTAQEMVYPLVPALVVVTLHGSALVLGLVEGLLAAAVVVGRLASARLLHGGASPRRLTGIAYVVSLVARPLLAVAPVVGVVLALRVADGLGKGGKDAPRDELVARDASTAAAGRAFGLQRALDTAGSVLGPLAAAAVLVGVGSGSGGLRLAIALSAVPAVACLLVLRRVRDVPPEHEPGLERAPLPRAFWWLAAAALVFGLANSSDTLLLLRAQSLGVSAAWLPALWAAFNLVYAALAIPAGVLSDRIGKRPLLVAGWTAYAIVYLGLAASGLAWQVVICLLGYGVYYASAEGAAKAWIAALVPAASRPWAYGLYAAAAGLLTLPASLLAGVIWTRASPGAAFATGAALAFVAVLVLAIGGVATRGGAIDAA